jgi:hypothetical protein
MYFLCCWVMTAAMTAVRTMMLMIAAKMIMDDNEQKK